MAQQIRRHLRRTVLGEVLGRTDHNQLERAQRAGHQPGVVRFSGPNDGIKTFLDDVHQPVGEIQVQFDTGVAAHEGDQRRHHQISNQG
ncbi:hypothetical protein D3C84_803180 [compost metagenome]